MQNPVRLVGERPQSPGRFRRIVKQTISSVCPQPVEHNIQTRKSSVEMLVYSQYPGRSTEDSPLVLSQATRDLLLLMPAPCTKDGERRQ